MAASTPVRTRRRLPRLLAGCLAVATLLAACGSSSTEPIATATDSAATPTTGATPTGGSSEVGGEAPTAPSSAVTTATEAATEAATEYRPSGPDGRYVVGDTYSDSEMLFTYEGLAAVPFDEMGERSDGECYLVLGTVTTLPDVPRLAEGDAISFQPSFDPIFGGTPDTEQSNEFFNCDVDPVQELGYTQSATTDVTVGETATVWIDAIWVAPDRVDTLEAFRLYGMDDIVFETEVTQDLVE